MPTLIQFVTGNEIVVEDDFDRVVSQLIGNPRGAELKRVDKGHDVRVMVYTASIAYLQEYQEPGGPGVAYG